MYHGADHPSYLLAKIGGFLFLPALGTLATRLAAPAVESAVPKANPGVVASVVGTVAFGALAYGLYQASEGDYSTGTQALFRGGMWGAGICAAFSAATPLVSPPGPVVAGTLPAVDNTFNLLTAQAAGAVAAKRSKKLAPAR
jgi:hypothetical protein